MDRNQTLLYMIADLYSENKQLKDEVSYLKKDNADYRSDIVIANADAKELREKVMLLIEKVALLEERLGKIKDKLECSFKNKKPLKVEDIGKILLLLQTWEMDKKGAE